MMEDQGTTYRIFQQCSKVAYRPVPLYYYYISARTASFTAGT